ncbi:meiotic recombination protein SPO11 [Nematocida ausubeli]|nr:meiotic recombination protein SPO11 [Nematocida ausubeli]KAI5161626.1 meiotic recombination protein SPO11 [Nematocida ausubeli]
MTRKNLLSVSFLAGILKDKSAFLLRYQECKYSDILYNDILAVIEDVIIGRMRLECAIPVLNVYYVILCECKEITIREIFYRCKRVFKNQNHTVRVIDYIKIRLKIEISLIVPSYKGLVHGIFSLKIQEKVVQMENTSIIPRIQKETKIFTKASAIIVVEKEAVFNDIIQDTTYKNRMEEIIIVTGKGYPCTNTLKFLSIARSIRIFGLFDCDPHGLSIYAVYKYGSKRNPHLKVPSMERIGIHLYEIPVTPETMYITDKKQISLIRNLRNLEELQNDINIMEETRRKASIEDILNISTIAKYSIDKVDRLLKRE